MDEYLTGEVDSVSYLSRSVTPFFSRYGRLVSTLNSELPDGSRIFLLYESRDFPIDHPTLGGSIYLSDWPLLADLDPSPPSPSAVGGTHLVLVLNASLAKAIWRRTPNGARHARQFARYRDRCLELVFDLPTFTVYGARGPSSGSG